MHQNRKEQNDCYDLHSQIKVPFRAKLKKRKRFIHPFCKPVVLCKVTVPIAVSQAVNWEKHRTYGQSITE